MSLFQMKIGGRLAVVVLAAFVALIALSTYQLLAQKQQMMADREAKVRNVVEVVQGVLEQMRAEVDAGRLTEGEAKELAKATVSRMHYDGDEYYWLETLDGVIIAHGGNPARIGLDVRDSRDANGKFFHREIIAAAKAGGGFVRYAFPHPGEQEPAPKISYAKEYEPWGWLVGSGIYIDDVNAVFWDSLIEFGLVAILIVILFSAIAWIVARSITGPLGFIVGNMMSLADNNKSIDIQYADQANEIGDLARAMSVFRDRAIEIERLRDDQLRLEHEAEAQRKASLLEMARHFEESVGRIVDQVSSSSADLSQGAATLSDLARQTDTKSADVSVSAEEASSNVATVSAAAEELTGSISEISQQVTHASEVASQAVSKADEVAETMQGLVREAQKIGEVLNLITDIADQTNLLALNATIEAARAGDAGKGFAVVASEVKSLAQQTARATGDIDAQIGGVQSSTEKAVQAIDQITSIIRSVDEIAASISAAVEEQGAATREIARNVEQAAHGTRAVSNTIDDVRRASNESGTASGHVRDMATSLAQQAETLKDEVRRFLERVRA
ncbi:HAMP domain-containing protein [Roseospira marina]|uniref:HAMP domain-containing protein n=1 Tax=Roseospira marina TaxID=140057 RepID=A0A5M6IAA6_9PROT|nr:cache domain-containing protein [Roseospira marina]KAA5604877.1 HAMP domain-containing protein [Roseospira marina]MBB4315214.1 methyl-accepting chemotaxis protein [Roseospira marina]MBB5088214.1 methyl-accepting chemotaxis protein [Roseospira marina]